jgi:hypothetical protein
MLFVFRGFTDAFKTQGNKSDKSFFFYPQKSINENTDQKKKLIEKLIDECEKLARQCDELKVNHYLTFDIFILKFISSSYYPNQNHREPQVQPKMKLVRINHDFEHSCIFFSLRFSYLIDFKPGARRKSITGNQFNTNQKSVLFISFYRVLIQLYLSLHHQIKVGILMFKPSNKYQHHPLKKLLKHRCLHYHLLLICSFLI